MTIIPVGGKSQAGLRIIFQPKKITAAGERGRMASSIFHVSAMGKADCYFLADGTSSSDCLPFLDFPFRENTNKRESLFSEALCTSFVVIVSS